MANNKRKLIRFSGNIEGFDYQAEAKKIFRNGKNIIDTQVWCESKENPGEEQLTKIAYISFSNVTQNLIPTVDSIQQMPQKKLLLPVLEELAITDMLIDKKDSKVMVSVCPTMAKTMNLTISTEPEEICVDPRIFRLKDTSSDSHIEQGGKNMSTNGTAPAQAKETVIEKTENPKQRETKDEKKDRADKKLLRFQRELKLLSSLTPEQLTAIDDVLKLLSVTQSTWLVSTFKLATATRSRELSVQYSEAEMSFECRDRSWSEIWKNPILKVKIYESMTTIFTELPDIFQLRLANLAKRIKSLRALKTKQA